VIRLVLGGERSGKSDFALRTFLADPGPHVVLATGQPEDFDFRRRIMAHRRERPTEIPVREAGADLAEQLATVVAGAGAVLVDSLDFWLFSVLGENGEGSEASRMLVEALGKAGSCRVTLVSCEVGLGPVAADAATRAFVRELGGVNQAVAAAGDEVFLVTAGLPLRLKGE
jgi:adenosylcobinamide kinase / adenosylcobinamide-phosphate guanylyltransferase